MKYQVRSNHNMMKVTKVFESLEDAKTWCDKQGKKSVAGYSVTHIEGGKLVRDYDVSGEKSNIRKWH